MDLEAALRQFDRVETNLRRLETVSSELDNLIPDGIVFSGSSAEGRTYNALRRDFRELAAALPSVDGYSVAVEPMSLDEIAQRRLDAAEISEPQILVDLGQEIGAAAEAIGEYRHRFARARGRLVRERAEQLVTMVDGLLPGLIGRHERDGESVAADPDWVQLHNAITEIRRLMAGETATRARWADLTRHLSFAQGVDLHDIADSDWPSVRTELEVNLYGENEPLPTVIEDLGSLVASRPAGSVSTAMKWSALDDAGFERLIFNLLSDASGYENPRWLTNTRAPDRGRDLSVDRVIADPLSGTTRQRLVVQCKHWKSKSVGPRDATEAVTKAELWDDPGFDALIIVTSGRFTVDAVEWIEKHNRKHRMTVEMWPDSHLEGLLASRPYMVEEFGLRPAAPQGS